MFGLAGQELFGILIMNNLSIQKFVNDMNYSWIVKKKNEIK